MNISKQSKPQSFVVAREAQRCLALLTPYTAGNESALRQELLDAGVSHHRVTALYPFDSSEHMPRMSALLNERPVFQKLASVFSASDVNSSFGVLPAEVRSLVEEDWDVLRLTMHRLLKAQFSSAHTNLGSDFVAKQWLDLLRFFYACSTVHKRVRLSSPIGLRVDRHRSEAQALLASLNLLGIKPETALAA